MMRFWPNAHALVTGAGSGIGAATAIALAKAGVRVSIAGRRIDALKATAASLDKQVGAVVSIDVTDQAAVTKGVAQIEAEAGPIDILVNNAGKAGSAPFDKTDAALWADMLASNLSSVFLVTHAVLPGMAQRGRGRVINVASTAGLTGYAYVSAYVAAKHGVIGLTRSLALEYARRGVTVNAVCPGYTDTPLVADAAANIVAKTGRSEQEARAALAKVNPMQRLVTPEEVADAILWLAAEGASSINGQAVAVAGGEVFTG
ncbi:NAD(P)-dependent dehydrogenase (short-subunit alcohol dehydrogenase family) [Bradyrhizobium sp. USDA 4524]|uniref:SDR family NAD(P)-dependent oxidoreductase n=1 Tax=unclassified Bradyrhizobium TaxID=2631580 RepID=UPI00209F7110|nr:MULTISPECIES: SDR family NAD(P)-dependent oxidoreductase [unclassified Bradyrhizobium]MCP1837300.1 NAD(P)-dependent dehydrogenase (short-subunit alcohol dehydrogenase family) [Bradyrhizobium sp. USDA 4538]MCP1906318.1 NAD(P)-dependent dehydrogenase (short-subunit alcohol dehydrogenase family) [Bradyrhizobium sp. USDA 4537]MCP1988027.1 NAD(P)-dependent dehydrogenase (short-subunit alcohol dehydrogenase family) [Bradyrhizobium sp. USDA 4539]